MKKFIFNLIIFFAAVGTVDFTFGQLCRFLIQHSKGGDTKSIHYVAKESDENILIFGSSRALHHYVPSIVTDSLNMSCYNCGWDGNGIIYQYGRLQMILQRYTPKVILYDVYSNFDIREDDHSKYLDLLKRYSDIPEVADVFKEVAPMEQFKLYSQLYRYNSTFSSMLMDYVKPKAIVEEGGYKPNYGVLSYDIEYYEKSVMEWDELKKDYFVRFIYLCKKNNINIVFIYSPMYHSSSSIEYTRMTQLCQEYDIDILDYYSDPRFQDREYYYDVQHLNDVGARYFTSQIVKDVRTLVAD